MKFAAIGMECPPTKTLNMRGMTIKSTLIFLGMVLGTQASAHVSLDNPAGNETFYSGEVVTIQWTELVAHGTIYWHLYFSSNGGTTWDAIQLNIPYGTLSYDWTVPELNTSEGVVRVVQDNPGMDYEHQCLNFTIIIGSAPPQIVDAAQDMTFECSSANQEMMIQNWLDSYAGASATSFCGDLTWTNDYTGLSEECASTGNASVTFTCSDECGNSSTTSAMLMIVDNTPPVIEMSALDLDVECDGLETPQEVVNWLDDHGNAMASDACGSVVWTNDFSDLGGGCASNGLSMVVFTATDVCGNTSTTSASLFVADTSPPDVDTEAQDITIECSISDQQVAIQAWIATHGGAVASDICSAITWSNDYSGLSNKCGETGSSVVTFTMTDDCGNSSTTMASLTVMDTEPPVFDNMPADISVECTASDREDIIQEWLNNYGGAVATDQCGDITWSNDYTVPGGSCIDDTMEPVTFVATDQCGNSVEAVVNIINTVSTGIADVLKISDVHIYPNPSYDRLHIDFDAENGMPKELSLYEIGGKLIWKDNSTSAAWVISVADLNSGIYLVKINTERGAIIQKVVVR